MSTDVSALAQREFFFDLFHAGEKVIPNLGKIISSLRDRGVEGLPPENPLWDQFARFLDNRVRKETKNRYFFGLVNAYNTVVNHFSGCSNSDIRNGIDALRWLQIFFVSKSFIKQIDPFAFQPHLVRTLLSPAKRSLFDKFRIFISDTGTRREIPSEYVKCVVCFLYLSDKEENFIQKDYHDFLSKTKRCGAPAAMNYFYLFLYHSNCLSIRELPPSIQISSIQRVLSEGKKRILEDYKAMLRDKCFEQHFIWWNSRVAALFLLWLGDMENKISLNDIKEFLEAAKKFFLTKQSTRDNVELTLVRFVKFSRLGDDTINKIELYYDLFWADFPDIIKKVAKQTLQQITVVEKCSNGPPKRSLIRYTLYLLGLSDFHGKKLQEITRADINILVKTLMDQKFSEKMINTLLSDVHRFFSIAQKQRLIHNNPITQAHFFANPKPFVPNSQAIQFCSTSSENNKKSNIELLIQSESAENIICVRQSLNPGSHPDPSKRHQIESNAKQIETLTNWVNKLGFTNYLVIEDKASGADRSRKGMQRIVELIKGGQTKRVFLLNLSRSARDRLFAYRLASLIRKYNVELWVYQFRQDRRLDLNNDGDYMHYVTESIINDEFIHALSQSVRWGWIQSLKARNNWPWACIPYGYMLGQNRRLEIVKKEAEVVRYIFEAIRHKSAGKIAIELEKNI